MYEIWYTGGMNEYCYGGHGSTRFPSLGGWFPVCWSLAFEDGEGTEGQTTDYPSCYGREEWIQYC